MNANDTIPILDAYLEPAPVPFSFHAPGWYAIAALLALILLVLLLWQVHRYRHNRYRRQAVALIRRNVQQATTSGEYAKLVYNANMIAKQICIRLYGRRETAALKDTPWIIFLNQSCRNAGFSTADEQILRAVYTPHIRIEQQQALYFAEKITHWIKKHRTRL